MNHRMIEQHVTDEQLLRMRGGAATPEEADRWLDHIADCDLCARRMAELFEEIPQLEVTPLFCESVWREIEETSEQSNERIVVSRTIVSRTDAADSRSAAVAGERRPAARQERTPRAMRSYPFKVVLAACVTLILMNAGMFGSNGIGSQTQRGLADKMLESKEKSSQELKDTSQRWSGFADIFDLTEGDEGL